MSFGFSISDFVICAQWAWYIYDALETGPAECQAFAKEVLFLHQILAKVHESLRDTNRYLSSEEGDALQRHIMNFEEFYSSITDSKFEDFFGGSEQQSLYMQRTPVHSQLFSSEALSLLKDTESARTWAETENNIRLLGISKIRERIRAARFAKKIPKLQRSVTAQIEKLTAFNVLLIQSNQIRVHESQERSENSQKRVESAQDRLEESQARIEAQLREILASRERQRTPLLSSSLDASSPEGRQAWVNLGRTLRKEGITPEMIGKNQSLLVRAIKDTLGRATSLADSFDQSFKTAHEYQSLSQRDPASLLGSAPPSAATFSTEFLQRHATNTNPLDHDENIASGMNSLLEGMSGDDVLAHGLENDFTEADELTDADVATMMHNLEDLPLLLPHNYTESENPNYDIRYYCSECR